VLAGSLIGIAVRGKLPQRYVTIAFQAIGLFTLFLGFLSAAKSGNFLLLVMSVVLGGICGEFFNIDGGVGKISDFVKRKVSLKSEKFTEGFLTSFLLFCMGSMTILGSFEEGLQDKHDLLFTKSLMDGISSIALGAALGIGVTFSAVFLLLYQASLTLFAIYLKNYLTEPVINEITAAGGIMLIGMGLNILEIKQIKVINMLPAILFAALFALLNYEFDIQI
jgi:uncharacterized membrane protein YqgA involved in biofilm formation